MTYENQLTKCGRLIDKGKLDYLLFEFESQYKLLKAKTKVLFYH